MSKTFLSSAVIISLDLSVISNDGGARGMRVEEEK